ncbi:hypothetical protein AURDEDRAFT_121079 [Auricularia subglabra TFB-10046 SS5]|nr:hypothetical protein AURDEDRAFT_121079 [Auricularia subglabra TFB-10046 SS5]
MVRARDASDASQQQGVFRGFIRSTYDALLVFEAALSGRIPRVTRRFTDNEKRNDIRSGYCFVFGEEEAEIKRWTDGITWSPSRINKNFLVRSSPSFSYVGLTLHPQIYRERYASDEPRPESSLRRDYENWLVGTLNTPEIKQDGLVKKEVLTGQLQRPSLLPQFKDITIRDSILDCRMLREPLKCELDSKGSRIPIPDEDGSAGSVSQQVTPPPDSPPRQDSRSRSQSPKFFALAPQQQEHDVSPHSHADGAFNFLPSPLRLPMTLPPFPVSEPLNSLEFFPDGFGNVAVNVPPGSPPGRRRSTRTAPASRWAPYALRARASVPETGSHSHAQLPPQAHPAEQPQAQQQHSSPVQQLLVPVQPPALVRTRSAPTPLELIPPPPALMPVYGTEPLSATLSEFDEGYYYGPITPQSVGGFDYFDLQQQPDGKFAAEQDALVMEDMSQYLVQGGWGGDIA